MAGVNKVILIGNLGQDPEVRHLEGEKVVANLSLATTESYKDRSGQRVDITEWHDLELWDGLARVAEQYLKKGSQIYVEGSIQYRQFDDKDGNTRYFTDIRVREMQMLGGRDGGSSGSYSDGGQARGNQTTRKPAVSEPDDSFEPDDGDLPF